jgi:hypothetical protein
MALRRPLRLAWISVRVRAEIDEQLPDDLTWSVAWQVTVVDRRRYDDWSLGRVNRRWGADVAAPARRTPGRACRRGAYVSIA